VIHIVAVVVAVVEYGWLVGGQWKGSGQAEK